MENIFIISLVCIFSIVTSSPIYNERQTFFRHRGDAIEHRSLRDESSQQSIPTQWFKRYYHAKTPEFDKDSHSSSAFPYTSDEFLALMKNLLNQQPHGNSEANKYTMASLNPDTDSLRYTLPFREDDDNVDNVIDYSDNYYGPTIMDSPQMEDNFQQALVNYLMQQNPPMMKHSNKQTEVDQQESQTKEAPITEALTASPTSLVSSTPSISSASSKATSQTLYLTDVTSSSNNLNVMPPVAIGKGQKEFPMLRPASENSRKFNTWAQNFEKSMAVNNFQQPQYPATNQMYPIDSLTEELNNWKSQNTGINKKSHPMWY